MANKEVIYIAGVDEAGRGPLAGPVTAAAVILTMHGSDNFESQTSAACCVQGLADSKQLTPKRREQLAVEIQEKAVAFSVGWASVEEIDQINILQASLLAMKRAVESLSVTPDFVKVDGRDSPNVFMPTEAIIKGDSLVSEISAASILAKVARDEEMLRLDELYPGYGFSKHKGYGTKMHFEAIEKLGQLPIHRKSFKLTRS